MHLNQRESDIIPNNMFDYMVCFPQKLPMFQKNVGNFFI